MPELRCNNCIYLKDGFCSKLGEALPTRLAKLFYGGAVGFYSGTVTYPSTCGIEKEQGRETEEELELLIPEKVEQGKRFCQTKR
jgi:hypothetical protein